MENRTVVLLLGLALLLAFCLGALAGQWTAPGRGWLQPAAAPRVLYLGQVGRPAYRADGTVYAVYFDR